MNKGQSEISLRPAEGWRRRYTDRVGVGQGEILSAPRWATVLEQFARVTGLATTLYNAEGQKLIGPFTPTPLSERLAIAGCWKKKGACVMAEINAIRACIEEDAIVFRSEHGMLALVAAPLRYEGECIGAIAAGWLFDNFPDPVPTNSLALQINVPYAELWQIARQQPPVSREKLGLCAGLLQTLSDAFVKERAETLKEQAQGRDLLALNRLAQALAAATCLDEIGAAVVEACISLAQTKEARLMVTVDGDSWHTAATQSLEDINAQPLHAERRAVTSKLRIPVEATDGTLLAVIEVTETQDFPSEQYQLQMSAVAAQTAVALQKLRLVADLQSQRERLERANRTKDEFLSVLSHELRTPLTPILGWVALLNRQDLRADSNTLTSGLEAIERNANQELQLVDELLDLSRILSEKVALEPELINPTDALASALVNAQTLAAARDLQLNLDTDQNLPLISVDPKRLQQILSNLVANAIKFTPDAGTITLGARRGGDKSVEFVVKDTGVGLKGEMLGSIFNRFQQADSTTTRRFGGLGIGLSVVRGLVELHGGTVWAESEGEHRGATFIVSFPIARVTKQLNERRVKKLQGKSQNFDGLPQRSGRVLVIDDSNDTVAVIKMMIEGVGYEVETADSVAGALEVLTHFIPDVVISDVGMPDADGFYFLKTIRENPIFTSVPVIALTGYASATDREKMLDAGFAAHLPKPVEPTALVAALDEALSRKVMN